MAKQKFKMIVPKAGANDEFGSTAKLYPLDEIVEPTEDWQKELMETFVGNGWAVEVKVDKAEEVAEEAPKRARNEKGHLVGDDPDTPDVNEAWEGGEAPKKKKAPAKKKKATTKKKTTKKKA